MKIAEVEANMQRLLRKPPAQDEFIFELLLAYGSPKATIARLRAGQFNLAKVPGEVPLKKKVWFKQVGTAVPAVCGALGEHALPKDLFAAIETMKTAKAVKANDPRFLIVKATSSSDVCINKKAFAEYGEKVALFPGVKEWFARINTFSVAHDVIGEH